MIPRLWKTHPSFFLSYIAIAMILHLGLGVTQIVDVERYFNPAFVHLYEIQPAHVWGWASVVACGLMVVGLYHKFHLWGRLGLCFGLFLCLSRGLLIELGPGSGGGIFVWLAFSIVQFAQLSEPTVNPLTAKE